LVRAARLAIWAIVGFWMKTTHLGEEYDNYVKDEDYDQYDEEDENLLPCRHATTRSTMNMTIVR
jgi:hypothetical protein